MEIQTYSMEKYSMEIQKFENSPKKVRNSNFDLYFDLSWRGEITLASSIWNISPTLAIDTSMERSSRVLQHGNSKIQKKNPKYFEIWLVTKSWNHISFVNISATLIIDTSMEKSSRALQHLDLKMWFFFSKKLEIRILTCILTWAEEL